MNLLGRTDRHRVGCYTQSGDAVPCCILQCDLQAVSDAYEMD
jgi:hypothetical protein